MGDELKNDSTDELIKWVEGTELIEASDEKVTTLSRSRLGSIDESFEALVSSSIADAIGHNEIEAMPYVRGVLPWTGKNEVRPWADTDDSYLVAYLQTEFGITNEKAIRHAFAIACDRTRFNPVIDTFESLPEWDGSKRAGYLFHKYLGADDNEYVQAVEILFLSGVIMRTFHPGVKFDYMPVLIGNQGIGKSTLARKLAMSDNFFTDSLIGIGKKEGAELVQGNLIVELAELDAIKGKELETIKAFISRTSDDYRAPYARRVDKHPRRFVLIGTTNSSRFLNDPSGNRRFLPVRCGVHKPESSIFSDEAQEIIEQVWAEMLYCYHESGYLPLMLPDTVKEEALREQNEATEEDPWVSLIESWLELREPYERVCVAQICEKVLGIERHKQKQWQQKNVRDILERRFPVWTRQKKKQRVAGYGTQLVYQKGSKDQRLSTSV